MKKSNQEQTKKVNGGKKEDINDVVKKIIKKLKIEGHSQVIGGKSEGYKRDRYNKFVYVRETDNVVILLREKGTEARIPYSKIAQAIEAVRTNPEIYTQGPSSLRKYGITHINSPVWSLLHLLSIDELIETVGG